MLVAMIAAATIGGGCAEHNADVLDLFPQCLQLPTYSVHPILIEHTKTCFNYGHLLSGDVDRFV